MVTDRVNTNSVRHMDLFPLVLAVPPALRSLVREIAYEWSVAETRNGHPSYDHLGDAVRLQWQHMRDTGLDVRPVQSAEPYPDTDAMFRDIAAGRLDVSAVCPPYEFGHPLFTYCSATGITLNTKFRAVHDYWGHWTAEAPFETFAGEVSAWRTHRQLMPFEAHDALFSETIGQLCYFTVYGDHPPMQRAVILPDVLMDEFERTTRRRFE